MTCEILFQSIYESVQLFFYKLSLSAMYNILQCVIQKDTPQSRINEGFEHCLHQTGSVLGRLRM